MGYTRLGFTQRDVDPLGNGDRELRATRCECGRPDLPHPRRYPRVVGVTFNPIIVRFADDWCREVWFDYDDQGSDQAKCDENISRSDGS